MTITKQIVPAAPDTEVVRCRPSFGAPPTNVTRDRVIAWATFVEEGDDCEVVATWALPIPAGAPLEFGLDSSWAVVHCNGWISSPELGDFETEDEFLTAYQEFYAMRNRQS